MDQTQAITLLLNAARAGEPGAADRLWRAVHAELRGMAAARMAREHGPRTLQPTALIQETYLRLFGDGGPHRFENRRHFFAAAARAMHQILVDDARHHRRLKRGGDRARRELSDDAAPETTDPAELLALDEALTRLEQERPEYVEIIRLRFFAGLSLDETAEVLGLARRTVAKRWHVARAWLYEAMTGDRSPEAVSDVRSMGAD